MKFRTVFIAIVAMVLTGCQDDGPERRDVAKPSKANSGPSFRIRLLNAQGLTYGDSLHFEVKSDDTDNGIAKVEVSKKNADRPISVSGERNFKVSSEMTGGGEFRLKFKAIFSDGKSTVRYKVVDIKPTARAVDWRLEVVKKYPHDVSAFTQGFLVHNGYIYEGTGNYGESRLRKMELNTGQAVQVKELSGDIFGEGITVFDGKVYQVTYKSGRGFVYDLESFDQIDEFAYYTETSEGWGLTHNDTCLILSDGSSELYFIDPATMEVERRLNVFDEDGSVDRLNELEYMNGRIYANIYTEPYIVELDAVTGQVINRYSALGIVDQAEANAGMDVLNGIAIHPVSGNLLVTGKYWSKIYEVKPIRNDGI